jgi:hypothetical protein
MNQMIMKEIIEAVKSVRYGSVDIIIHDSDIVQIEIKEKVRFDQRKSKKVLIDEELRTPLS